jgi:SpoVK/Ycf46/Vps4 family AAA+-type ATPase
MKSPVNETQAAATRWAKMNQAYLNRELLRLRLLLQRRTAWLRRQWKHDPIQNYQMQVISDDEADWLLTGDDHEAEATFYQKDPEALALSQRIAKLEAELAELKQALVKAGTPPALEVLSHRFGLTPFERDVLLLCLAPELDATFERLYAYVQDDVSRKYGTIDLALALFSDIKAAEDGCNARNSFLPEAPLRRFCLITLGPGSSPATALRVRPLRLDERVIDYLRGVNRPDDHILDWLRPIPYAPLARSHQALAERLVRGFEWTDRQNVWPVLNLTGSPGTGKMTVARALCSRLGLQLYRLNVNRLPAPGPDRRESLRLLEREAALLQIALYLDTSDVDRADKGMVSTLSDVIEQLNVLLIVGSHERWQVEDSRNGAGRETITVRIPEPDASVQRELWHSALTGVPHTLDDQIDHIVQQFDFGPQDIAEVVSAAQGKARLHASETDMRLTPDDLWQACREQAGWHLNELAQHIDARYTWEDIVLPEDLFNQLQELVAQVAHRSTVYETWGFGTKLIRGRGISALFAGPSGTGKTMAAEILANHLKLDLYRIDLAGVVSKYIGETEKNLKKVFDAAEQSGAILFFDEADALFGKRTEVKVSHDRYAIIEINYLLQRMEDYRGLAILATNRKSELDRAFLRRLRFLVDFPFPDAESRRRIWQKVFPSQAKVGQLDYDCLARLEIPGGNIKNIALNAAFLAAGEGEGARIEMTYLMHATRREYAKIDKSITPNEFGPYFKMVKP